VIDPAAGDEIIELVKRYAALRRQYHRVSSAGPIPGFF
jgi:hypothetical protein